MILEEIKKQTGIDEYNVQLRKFLEEQYQVVAVQRANKKASARNRRTLSHSASKKRGDQVWSGVNTATDDGGQQFLEILKHLKHLDQRLETSERAVGTRLSEIQRGLREAQHDVSVLQVSVSTPQPETSASS